MYEEDAHNQYEDCYPPETPKEAAGQVVRLLYQIRNAIWFSLVVLCVLVVVLAYAT